MEKNAKSGFTLLSNETAIIPLIPIKNTIGIIIIKDTRDFFLTLCCPLQQKLFANFLDEKDL